MMTHHYSRFDNLGLEPLTFLFTFGISLIVYLKTVSPSIAGGDSGELVAEGCQLGTSHPPGYPLYTILVYIITNIGARVSPSNESPAYFVNVSSCIFGAACSGLISCSILSLVQYEDIQNQEYNLKKKKKKSKKEKVNVHKCEGQNELCNKFLPAASGVASGLMHSFSPLAWQYSVTAEVFALHNLFVALIVHTTIRFAIRGTKNLFLLGAFLCGLALTNQHTSILLVLPLIMWVFHITQLYRPKKWIKKYGKVNGFQLIGMAALMFLCGLILLYATLPVFSSMYSHPGSWGDVSSFRGFINHFTRKDYGTLRLYSGNDDDSECLWERLVLWIKDFAYDQANPVIVICLIFTLIEFLSIETRRMLLPSHIKKENKWIDKHEVTVTLKSTGSPSNGTLLVQKEERRMGLLAILTYSLLFYLVVFHSLANLPLKTPLLFGVHQRFWMHPNILCFILGGVGLAKVARKFARKSRALMHIITMVFVVVVSFSYRRGIAKSDHSQNVFMRNYASSILKTLPSDSLIFINYDQQWTSIRYMQECEGLRTDVTSINLSMMSYEWWDSKRKLYPNMTFPGSHLTPYVSNKRRLMNRGTEGFSFSELIETNYNAFQGNIFIGGYLSYPDKIYETHYDEVPHGIVRKIKKRHRSYDVNDSMEEFRNQSRLIWKIVAKEHSTGLPDPIMYGQNTWEWTVRREFFDHFISRATHLLDLAVNEGNNNLAREEEEYSSLGGKKQVHTPVLKSLVEAVSWLEIARVNDDYASESPSLWKNLGLGYMHMVRNKEGASIGGKKAVNLPPIQDLFRETKNAKLTRSIDNVWWKKNVKTKNGYAGVAVDKNNDWKSWASTRWESTWENFLEMKEAKSDPSYTAIKNIYESVMSSSGKRRK